VLEDAKRLEAGGRLPPFISKWSLLREDYTRQYAVWQEKGQLPFAAGGVKLNSGVER
jgi:hypothetical protein